MIPKQNGSSRVGKIKIVSFGFKYGLPSANYYFDVSFAKNPAREKEWGMFGNADHKMIEFVLSQKPVAEFIDLVVPLVEHIATLDSFQVVAFGCSSGRHRSPIIVDEIANRLINKISISIVHRELPDYEAFLYEISHGKKPEKH